MTGPMGEPSGLIAKLEETGNMVYPIRSMRSFIQNHGIDSVRPLSLIHIFFYHRGKSVRSFITLFSFGTLHCNPCIGCAYPPVSVFNECCKAARSMTCWVERLKKSATCMNTTGVYSSRRNMTSAACRLTWWVVRTTWPVCSTSATTTSRHG